MGARGAGKPPYFNSRPRTGGDRAAELYGMGFFISIHAPARGATQYTSQWNSIIQISIHAPARGATIDFHTLYSFVPISIHAPARGATGLDVGSGFSR